MKKIFQMDVYRIITSWRFYFTIIMIIISGFLTLRRNYYDQDLISLTNVGTLNCFIFSNVKNNFIVSTFAPFFPTLCISTIVYDDKYSGNYKNIVSRYDYSIYFKSKALTALISGSLVFLIPYVIMMGAFFIIDPSASVRLEMMTVMFSRSYNTSLLLFCIVFIMHSVLFGMAYAILAMGISLNIKNRYVGISLPIIIYYATSYIISVINQPILTKILLHIIPFMTFEITSIDISISQNLGQIITVFLVGLIGIIIAKHRYEEQGK